MKIPSLTPMELTMMDDMHLSLVHYFDGGNSDCFRFYKWTQKDPVSLFEFMRNSLGPFNLTSSQIRIAHETDNWSKNHDDAVHLDWLSKMDNNQKILWSWTSIWIL